MVEDSNTLSIPINIIRDKINRDESFSLRFHKAVATFLAMRLQKTNLFISHGDGVKYDGAETKEDDFDEIDEEIIEVVSDAGNKFKMLADKFN